MPTNIRVIHARDFIRARADGLLDRETSMSLLAEIAAAGAALAERHVLLDTRQAQSVMSVADLWFLASELATHGAAREQRTAVLCPTDEFDRAEFFALCAQNRGLRIAAFTAFEDAIEWLIAGWPDA